MFWISLSDVSFSGSWPPHYYTSSQLLVHEKTFTLVYSNDKKNQQISAKRTITSHFKSSSNTSKAMRYGIGHYGTVMEQAQQYGGIKPLNGIPFPLW
jgi:hypothetical protein